jgi:desampylase
MWVMNLTISRQHLQQLNVWAKEAHPLECCGLLLGEGGRVLDIVRADNVSPAPERNFEIDPAVLISFEKAARDGEHGILGCFHSHPNGVCEPSVSDAQQANRDGRYWVILAAGKAAAWRSVMGGESHDCFEPAKLITVI